MNRRDFIRSATVAAAGVLLGNPGRAAGAGFSVVRRPAGQRKFSSAAVEKTIRRVRGSLDNRELGWMFENCFPNTLDTTVNFALLNGQPDTYVITGDIDAMWLRDSSAQVWPYLPLMAEDPALQQLIAGVINRQTRCILKDSYANAFYRDEHQISQWQGDRTEMKPGVHERKWEIDSLCFPVRLAYGYWKTTGDSTPFNPAWQQAVRRILETFREQQRKPVNATKLKNLMTGKVTEYSFHQSEKVEQAEIETREVKYLYNSRGEWWFCEADDPSKRFKVTEEQAGPQAKFLKANIFDRVFVLYNMILTIFWGIYKKYSITFI